MAILQRGRRASPSYGICLKWILCCGYRLISAGIGSVGIPMFTNMGERVRRWAGDSMVPPFAVVTGALNQWHTHSNGERRVTGAEEVVVY